MAECRICKQQINKEKDDWVMPSRNYYFHRKCYQDWKKTKPLVDEEWKPFIYDFISRDLKVSYNYHMVEAQLKKFLKEDMTMKGVYFALKYFYEIKNNDWNQGNGGIGIVPYVYRESCTYWAKRERMQEGTIAEIERQMREAMERPKKVVVRKDSRPQKGIIDLSSIADMEDDE